jgi:hypothetical protein
MPWKNPQALDHISAVEQKVSTHLVTRVRPQRLQIVVMVVI